MSKAKVTSLDAVRSINEVETSPASTAGAHAELLHKLHALFNRKRRETGNIKLAQIGEPYCAYSTGRIVKRVAPTQIASLFTHTDFRRQEITKKT